MYVFYMVSNTFKLDNQQYTMSNATTVNQKVLITPMCMIDIVKHVETVYTDIVLWLFCS